MPCQEFALLLCVLSSRGENIAFKTQFCTGALNFSVHD
uniref:Uncharacterized protein n=1 Tax=viral metagenome TaxID=1070528 RepID=A0A6C0DSN3_9ZZZZ